MTASEGVMVKYNKQAATFRISHQGFDRKMDVEDVDMATLEDILIMGPKYGDQRTEWGKTRDECRRAVVHAAILQESWEEIVHNNVPLGRGDEEPELGRAEYYTADEEHPVIFDDEPRNPSELAKHPEREEILVSADKEIDQLIEQEIGVEVTPAEAKQVTEKGIRILQCKMVYKRKYAIGEDGKERFLKWKSRLSVVGSSEREGWETVYNTFSPTVAFSAIRLLISLTVDPKFSVVQRPSALPIATTIWSSGSSQGTALTSHTWMWPIVATSLFNIILQTCSPALSQDSTPYFWESLF